MNNELEALWIEQIKTKQDSLALDNLVQKYQPMIDNMYRQYFIVGFDHSDWYQEAFLVCYQTCLLFDGTTGSKFGSFFKLKFKNHIIDLIRRENAIKRKANSVAEPLDKSDQNKMTTPGHKRLIELSEYIEHVTKDMQYDELVAMQFIYGKISLEEACQKTKYDLKKFFRVVYQCKNRITKYGS